MRRMSLPFRAEIQKAKPEICKKVMSYPGSHLLSRATRDVSRLRVGQGDEELEAWILSD
jgi:hypothetical protein